MFHPREAITPSLKHNVIGRFRKSIETAEFFQKSKLYEWKFLQQLISARSRHYHTYYGRKTAKIKTRTFALVFFVYRVRVSCYVYFYVILLRLLFVVSLCVRLGQKVFGIRELKLTNRDC